MAETNQLHSELVDLREQCIASLYLCADNALKYLDDEKDAELDKLRTCVQDYCSMEAMQDIEIQALVMAKRETDTSNLSTLSKRYSEHLKRMERRRSTQHTNHPFMQQFERIVQRQQRTNQELDDTDIVITETQDNYLDPLLKRPIRDPVRNTICGHVYERESILGHIQRGRPKCPAMGCGNPEPVVLEHLVTDHELRLWLRSQAPAADTSALEINDSQ